MLPLKSESRMQKWKWTLSTHTQTKIRSLRSRLWNASRSTLHWRVRRVIAVGDPLSSASVATANEIVHLGFLRC